MAGQPKVGRPIIDLDDLPDEDYFDSEEGARRRIAARFGPQPVITKRRNFYLGLEKFLKDWNKPPKQPYKPSSLTY